jgi:signal transduction histidine kinase
MKYLKLILLLFAICNFNISNAQSDLYFESDTIEIKNLILKSKQALDRKIDDANFFAKKALEKAIGIKNNIFIIKAHIAMGFAYYYEGKYDSALLSNKLACALATATKDSASIGLAFNNQANVFVEMAKQDSAKFYYQKAYAIRSLLTNKNDMASANFNMGYIFKEMAIYDSAISYTYKAAELFEACKLPHKVANCYDILVQIYLKKEDLNKAFELNKKAITIYNSTNAFSNLSTSMHCLGTLFSVKGMHDSARYYLNEAMKIADKLQDKRQLTIFNADYGEVLINEKKYESATPYILKSIALQKEINNFRNLSGTYSTLARCYIFQKLLKNAKAALDSAYSYAALSKIKLDFKLYYKSLSEYYKLKGDAQASLKALENFYLYKDSIMNEENLKMMANLDAQYDSKAKEKTILQQNAKLSKSAKTILYLIVFSLIAFLGIFIFNKINSRIKDRKMQAALILKEEQKKNEIAAAAEQERKRISRDLHDNMGAYTSALLANVDALKRKGGNTEDLAKMKDNAEHILASLRDTIWVLNNKEIAIQDFTEQFKNYCFKVFRNFENINFEFFENIDNNKILPSVTALHLNKILQEVIQNIVKHAKANNVTMHISSNNLFEIQIADNGIGIDDATLINGNGLENMKWRSEEINYDIKIIKNEPTGVCFNIIEK